MFAPAIQWAFFKCIKLQKYFYLAFECKRRLTLIRYVLGTKLCSMRFHTLWVVEIWIHIILKDCLYRDSVVEVIWVVALRCLVAVHVDLPQVIAFQFSQVLDGTNLFFIFAPGKSSRGRVKIVTPVQKSGFLEINNISMTQNSLILGHSSTIC